jgi:signal transduction histidine kinase
MSHHALFEHQSRMLRVAPFAASIAVAVILFPFGSDVTAGWTLAAAAVFAAATLLTAALLPWEQAASAACLAPIVLFLTTVALLRDVHGGVDSGYSPLVLVPVVWAAIFTAPRVIAVAVVAAGLTLALPAAIGDERLYPGGDVRRAAVLTLIAAVIGWLVRWLVTLVDSEMEARERAEHALARLRASQIHDDIVQYLTAAQLGIALAKPEAVEDGDNRALASAREVVAELMHDDDPIEPGTLRRVEPAPDAGTG